MTSTMPDQLRVLIIDDNALLCATLERWLSHEPGIGWVDHLTDWRLAIANVQASRPDVVLLDIDFPGTSGLMLIDPLLHAAPGTHIIMLSGLVTRLQIEQAIDRGASGYIVKDQDSREIAGMVQRAARGEIVLCSVSLAVWAASDART